jgi:hypothetical protein
MHLTTSTPDQRGYNAQVRHMPGCATSSLFRTATQPRYLSMFLRNIAGIGCCGVHAEKWSSLCMGVFPSCRHLDVAIDEVAQRTYG